MIEVANVAHLLYNSFYNLFKFRAKATINKNERFVMSISSHMTSTNGKILLYRDLPYIMLITGKAWKPSEMEFLQWSTIYPDADLAEELRRIEDWFQKHSDRRKTERGMHAFVKTWLNRKIHSAAVSQYGTKRGRYHNAFNDFSLRQEYDFGELEADLLSISSGTDTNESKQTLDLHDPK